MHYSFTCTLNEQAKVEIDHWGLMNFLFFQFQLTPTNFEGLRDLQALIEQIKLALLVDKVITANLNKLMARIEDWLKADTENTKEAQGTNTIETILP